MNSKGIETKVFYSPLICDAKIYQKSKKYNLSNSYYILSKILALPFHESLSLSQIKFVVKQIRKFYEK